MPADLPCPVAVRFTRGGLGERVRLGLLLEWKQVVDRRGNPEWRGLVVYALPGAGAGGSWEVTVTWMDAAYLTPVESPGCVGREE